MELKIKVDESSKKYDRLLHYCSIETLQHILCDKTLRCSSLDYVNLNDKFECKRRGIEKYAKDFLVACFCNYQHEIVSFWYNYGGDILKEKVLLKFTNFSNDLQKYIYTDYLITDEGKKMFFASDHYMKTVNQNGIMGELMNLPPINMDFDTRNYIRAIRLKDIEYLPITDYVFTKNYTEEHEVSLDDGETFFNAPISDIRILGQYKTEHWAYEQETRMICQMGQAGIQLFDYVLVRLKDKFFSDLKIIVNPWSENQLKHKIKGIIDSSSIKEDVKSTIKIEKSELHGLLRE